MVIIVIYFPVLVDYVRHPTLCYFLRDYIIILQAAPSTASSTSMMLLHLLAFLLLSLSLSANLASAQSNVTSDWSVAPRLTREELRYSSKDNGGLSVAQTCQNFPRAPL